MRGIYVAIPCYTGQNSYLTTLTIVRAMQECQREGWGIDIAFNTGNTLVALSRNILLSAFLKSGFDDLFWLDADVGAPAGSFTRMMKHPVDMVAGLYRWRSDPERYSFRPLPGKTREASAPDPATGLIEVECIASGFLRITRAAVQQMIEAHPDRTVNQTEGGEAIPFLFDSLVHEGKYWGEDYGFCLRAREAGLKVWMDPRIPLTHHGQKVFSGCFADHEKQRLAAA